MLSAAHDLSEARAELYRIKPRREIEKESVLLPIYFFFNLIHPPLRRRHHLRCSCYVLRHFLFIFHFRFPPGLLPPLPSSGRRNVYCRRRSEVALRRGNKSSQAQRDEFTVSVGVNSAPLCAGSNCTGRRRAQHCISLNTDCLSLQIIPWKSVHVNKSYVSCFTFEVQSRRPY